MTTRTGSTQIFFGSYLLAVTLVYKQRAQACQASETVSGLQWTGKHLKVKCKG